MRTLLTLLVLTFFSTAVFAQEAEQAPAPAEAVVTPAAAPVAAPAMDAQKRELILKFIDVFGTRKALEQNFAMMLEQMPSDKPQEAAQLKERVKIDEIIELLLPIYDRNFSAQELQAFIDFYQSPNGQKLINTIPVLMQDSVEVSAQYLESKFPELEEEVGQEEGAVLGEAAEEVQAKPAEAQK